MEQTITTLIIIISVLLSVGILLQRSSSGIEGALGGGSSFEGYSTKRRGAEASVFQITLLLAIGFAVLNIVHITF